MNVLLHVSNWWVHSGESVPRTGDDSVVANSLDARRMRRYGVFPQLVSFVEGEKHQKGL